MLNVGVDWGERTPNQFSIFTDDGKLVKTGSVVRSVKGAYDLIDHIRELETDPQKVRIGIDRKGDVISSVLHSEGYQVFPLNPLSAERARDIYYPAGQKDDAADCKVHAHMVRTSWRTLRPLTPDDEKDQRIRALLGQRNHLVDMRAQNRQRLASVLAEASPILSQLCGDLRLQWVKDLLMRWPLEQQFTDAHGNALNAFLDNHPLIRESTEGRIRAAWRQPPYEHDEASAECYELLIKTLMETIASLGQQIERLEEKIGELLDDHQESHIFSSLPTDSEITIAAFCTAFGPDRDEPYDWSDYSGYFGTSPITETSGKSKQVKMRRARDETVHKALLDFADSSRKKTCCWAHAYYQRKRSEGLSHYHALRCLASRWVKILHAMWRNRSEYDEEFHRRRRRERGNIRA